MLGARPETRRVARASQDLVASLLSRVLLVGVRTAAAVIKDGDDRGIVAELCALLERQGRPALTATGWAQRSSQRSVCSHANPGRCSQGARTDGTQAHGIRLTHIISLGLVRAKEGCGRRRRGTGLHDLPSEILA